MDETVTRKLHLSASRDLMRGGLAEYSYAYLHADRPVRYKSELITIQPDFATVTGDDNGEISFDIIPNELVDNQKPFLYTVGLYGPDKLLIVRQDFVMPNREAFLWEFVPEPVNLDATTPIANISGN